MNSRTHGRRARDRRLRLAGRRDGPQCVWSCFSSMTEHYKFYEALKFPLFLCVVSEEERQVRSGDFASH
ncbi:hypothetical protein EVAR_92892_1 [Eumeta japonica]|uniref:Uncharacterized protein n=1 Tax=Eumeta variegata TaxID=151549 RepID=A0A4C1TB24_EUMVA|nr:hypothetical protein EVAR_92892_1 [Eumeta japonica]